MSAESIVKAVFARVPKAVAAGVVDLQSGLLLSIRTVESHRQEVLDILAPATQKLFEGELVPNIEDLFKQARGIDSDERYFQEILISSTGLWHYFSRLRSDPGAVVTVVTRGDVNLGMLIARCREIIEKGAL